MKRLAVFASGSGSNFEAIAEGCKSGVIAAEVALCVCDKAGAYVIQRAEKFGIPTLVFNPKDFGTKREFEKMIANRMDAENIDLVCLAGYMRIIGDELLERYGGKIINIHPALLPAFPGAHAIKDAFEYGVKVYGVTIHEVDATLDGGKIISQVAVPYEGDDIDELEAMIHRAEHKLYVETINKIIG
ncbi:MAG: phosphoribosylglycinamide formyltransferase [Tidjanibacter sp.]|nr:phosphoribosylglycinamide formyltransferase [Tidjanibacter sp.]